MTTICELPMWVLNVAAFWAGFVAFLLVSIWWRQP